MDPFGLPAGCEDILRVLENLFLILVKRLVELCLVVLLVVGVECGRKRTSGVGDNRGCESGDAVTWELASLGSALGMCRGSRVSDAIVCLAGLSDIWSTVGGVVGRQIEGILAIATAFIDQRRPTIFTGYSQQYLAESQLHVTEALQSVGSGPSGTLVALANELKTITPAFYTTSILRHLPLLPRFCVHTRNG
jgi:hypothetical protein